MNESNRNTRTLIVCFVIAIMFLIPLRFVEVGQGMMNYSNSQVLGETVSIAPVVLPNAVVDETMALEAPYNEIESKPVKKTVMLKQEVKADDCIVESDSRVIVNQLKNQIAVGQLTKAEIDEVVEQITEISKKVCQ